MRFDRRELITGLAVSAAALSALPAKAEDSSLRFVGVGSETIPERQIPKDVLNELARQERLAIFYDWMTLVFAGGAALFSGGAAIQTHLSNDKRMTSILGGLGTLFAVTQVLFKFPDRFAKSSSCAIALKEAILQYQTDRSLDEKWLGAKVEEALKRLE